MPNFGIDSGFNDYNFNGTDRVFDNWLKKRATR